MTSYQTIEGFATDNGTAQYAIDSVEKGVSPNHFRQFSGLTLSSIGMGTYLGDITNAVDQQLENAIVDSVMSGASNVIDTAINYRAMKSEKCIGRALMRLQEEGITRQQLFISTKNGYLTNDGDYPSVGLEDYINKMYIDNGVMSAEDISPAYHVMNPQYIARCIDKSLSNMHLSTIDLVYIHNSFESWYKVVDKEAYLEMLTRVFEQYERHRSLGKLRFYGIATWTCFRVQPSAREHLSIENVLQAAKSAGGNEHGFRFIQMPYNIAYFEASSMPNQALTGENRLLTPLQAAQTLGVGVFASVPLMQGRLLGLDLPPDLRAFPTDPRTAKIVQIVRSSPGIVSALIGQKKPEHVRENSKIARIPPLDDVEFSRATQQVLALSR